MLDCRACLHRCLRALSPPASRLVQRPLLRPTSATNRAGTAPIWARTITAEQLEKQYARELEARSLRKRAKRLREVNAETEDHKRLQGKVVPQVHRKILCELRQLDDPFALAERVKKGIDNGQVDEMEALVREASRNRQVVVSWNHLLANKMKWGQINAALKAYQEMKKRAQIPDAHTFGVLLRGIAAHPTANNVGKGLSLYHSMKASNSPVRPNILHTNSVLNACAAINDMDGLWGIASGLPEKGPNGADATTYTIILRALTRNALKSNPLDMPAEELAAVRDAAVVQGRRIWREVVAQWRAGDITVDEHLVCAMGRLLLIGARPRDWDDVPSLVEQTMNIRRKVAPLAPEARREAGEEELVAPPTPRHMTEEDEFDDSDEPMRRGSEFASITTQREVHEGSDVTLAPSAPSLAYVKPSNHTLSILLEACLKLAARRAATAYWDVLTSPPHAITPDLNNLLNLLRILRQARSSAAALDLLQHDIPGYGLAPNHAAFRIAMSTCVRDRRNPNVLANATSILGLMRKTLDHADPGALAMFLDVAGYAATADADAALRAAEEAASAADSVRSALAYGDGDEVRGARRVGGRTSGDEGKASESREEGFRAARAHRENALEALRRFVSLCDRLLSGGGVERAVVEERIGLAKRRAEVVLTRAANADVLKKRRVEKEYGEEEGGKGEEQEGKFKEKREWHAKGEEREGRTMEKREGKREERWRERTVVRPREKRVKGVGLKD